MVKCSFLSIIFFYKWAMNGLKRRKKRIIFFKNSILVIQKWIKFYSIPNKKSGKLESINITFSVSIYTGYLVIDSCRAIFIQMWKHIDGSAVVHILFPRKIIARDLDLVFQAHFILLYTHGMEWTTVWGPGFWFDLYSIECRLQPMVQFNNQIDLNHIAYPIQIVYISVYWLCIGHWLHLCGFRTKPKVISRHFEEFSIARNDGSGYKHFTMTRENRRRYGNKEQWVLGRWKSRHQ